MKGENKIPTLATQRHPVKIEYGVPKVSQQIAEFMASCKAKENTRYALNYVGITDGKMAVTDGRRLLVIAPIDSFEPPIADGIYHLTGEGFLLKTDEDRTFPKWQDIIPKAANNLGEFVLSDGSGLGLAKILRAILETKGIWNIKWLLGALAKFQSCGCSSVTIKDPGGNCPIWITAESTGVYFQYVQMPLSDTG